VRCLSGAPKAKSLGESLLVSIHARLRQTASNGSVWAGFACLRANLKLRQAADGTRPRYVPYCRPNVGPFHFLGKVFGRRPSLSKIIYVCNRTRPIDGADEKRLRGISDALVPDNVKSGDRCRIRVDGNIGYAVSLPNDLLHEEAMSVLLGFLFEERKCQWAGANEDYPDGNYALFKTAEDRLEVATDAAGTRTIWYYLDEERFVAATSQRAIVMFLRAFTFDERVVPWILSTGSLGPELSWDRRLRRLQANASLCLDKRTWRLSVNQKPIVFSESYRHPEGHAQRLSNAMRSSIKYLRSLDFEKWILPLSGGYDSRAILCFIKEELEIPAGLTTVTWGLGQSAEAVGNDADVARTLAGALGVANQYYPTDASSEPIEVVVDRFLSCGEGRIDAIAAYTDGMEMWRHFQDQGVMGIIRGDVGFSTKQFRSEPHGRVGLGCGVCSDFSNLDGIVEEFGFPPQSVPPEFRRTDSETFDAWRDRLYHAYRLPTILAAASDVKLSYVEQINPLLSRSVLDVVKSLPDEMRNNKKVFKKIVTDAGPRVRFANSDANASASDILRSPEFSDLLQSEIGSDYAVSLFGYKFTNKVRGGIKNGEKKTKTYRQYIRAFASQAVPTAVKVGLRDRFPKPEVDPNILAFRVFMVARMHKLLTADAGRMIV